ncbi:MAG: hypothetical protein C0628_09205 [Sulfurimonas sp.]|nr:MAG: hypothetical protein C0628_09205 [Sulfurimonas sp.]
MKKILVSSLIFAISVIFVSCAKAPFKPQQPLDNAALVYVYVSSEDGMKETYRNPAYKIGVNGKKAEGYIKDDEYIALDLKTGKINLTATRAEVEEQSIDLDLKAGEIYYLKIRSFSDDFAKFDIVKVKSNVGEKEIAKTVNPNAKNIVEKEIESASMFISKKEPLQEEKEQRVVKSEPAPVRNLSKLDELEKAYKMKEQGVLTEEEFKALKTQIITK